MKDFFVDYTTLKWVKWTDRKPTWNGSVYMRYNGKNTGIGMVFKEVLHSLSGVPASYFKDYEDTFYWLEEIHDTESWENDIP